MCEIKNGEGTVIENHRYSYIDYIIKKFNIEIEIKKI